MSLRIMLEELPEDARPTARPTLEAEAAMEELTNAASDLTTTDTADAVLDLYGSAKRLMAAAKALNAAATQAFIGWLRANEGSLEVGDIRYYVATEKKTRVPLPDKLLERLFTECGGDIESVARMLASDAFKPGAVKELLGEDAAKEFFVTEEVFDVKTGKPKKKLHEVDKRFLPKKGGAQSAPASAAGMEA